jgi:hypothetical protein
MSRKRLIREKVIKKVPVPWNNKVLQTLNHETYTTFNGHALPAFCIL